MNKELLVIIESLCHRDEYTGHSGLSFINSKPEMCRIIHLNDRNKCYGIDCNNCLFTRGRNIQAIYPLRLEKVIQTF
jgi:hypothetical protein